MGYANRNSGIVGLRRQTTTVDGGYQYSFTIPVNVSRIIAPLHGRKFLCELTEDGILFRLVPETEPETPEWVKS